MSLKHKWEARAFLLRHYRETIKNSWKKRKQMGGNLFNEDEAEFLPAALAVQEKPVSRASRVAAFALIILVIALFVWAIFGKMDIIVTASGEIIPSGRTKTISAIEVAAVKAIYVREGQAVKKGDLLIELDARMPAADEDKAMAGKDQAILQIARSNAMIRAVDSLKSPELGNVRGVPREKAHEAQRHLDGQYQDFITKLRRIEALIKNHETALPLATQQAADYKELSKNNDVSIHSYIEKEQARIELEGRLIDARNQKASLVAETKRAAHEARTEGERMLGISQPEVRKAAFHSELLKLVSPVDGNVQQLQVHTVGGVVPAAQPLMQIVPRQHQIEVDAMVLNKDVGFVKEGQTAAAKIEAFPYTKWGLVPAKVTHISRDAIKDKDRGLVYSVIVALEKSSMIIEGRDVPLNPGMAVTVDIKTGERRIVEYILSPLLKMKKESLRER